MKKSNLDVAYEILEEREDGLSFLELWREIVKRQEYSDEVARNSIGKFYTNLVMDGRFIALKDNEWALRDRHTFKEAHIDMSEVYSDDDKSEEVDDDGDENNSIFDEEKNDEDSDDEDENEFLNDDEDL